MKHSFICLSLILLAGCSKPDLPNNSFPWADADLPDGETITMSFLSDPSILSDTTNMLHVAGAPKAAIVAFAAAVTHYNATSHGLDVSRLPEPIHGVRRFTSAASLVRALPHRLCETAHPYEVNCFFPVLTLSGIRSTLRPDDPSGPHLPMVLVDSMTWDTCTVSTAQDAFMASHTKDYITLVQEITGLPWTASRVSLNASLHTVNVLPRMTTEQTLCETLLSVLRERWSRLKVTFPANADVVLFHSIELKKRFCVLTDHAGLLLSQDSGYVYIEKTGGAGPFVRLDFKDKQDLLTYFCSHVTEESKGEMTHFILTINDEEAYWIDSQ